MSEDGDDRTIGTRLRQIRHSRRKSLRVVAELAGMSKTLLGDVETGKCQLTSHLHLIKLAQVLEVAPSELTALPFPAPTNGHSDATIEAVRLVLDAIDVGRPVGCVEPVAVLRHRVTQVHTQRRRCEHDDVAVELPNLMRDAHATLLSGLSRVEHGEMLTLCTHLHTHVTRLWLQDAGAPADLVRRAAFLARRLAQESGDQATLAVASFGVGDALLIGGSFPVGMAELKGIVLPPVGDATGGLSGLVTAHQAIAAVLDNRPADVIAAMAEAADLADRFGRTGVVDGTGFLCTPVDVAIYRMWLALEAGDPDATVRIARAVTPERHPFPSIQAHYWSDLGLALVRLKKRDDAVVALRRAEALHPTMISRSARVRDALAGLVRSAQRNAVGRELRGMAYRAGLSV